MRFLQMRFVLCIFNRNRGDSHRIALIAPVNIAGFLIKRVPLALVLHVATWVVTSLFQISFLYCRRETKRYSESVDSLGSLLLFKASMRHCFRWNRAVVSKVVNRSSNSCFSVCGGREADRSGNDGLGRRFSLDRLLPRRDLRPLDAMIVPTGRISLKEEKV